MGGRRTLHALPGRPGGPEEEAFDVRVERLDGTFRVTAESPALEADVERRDQGAWSVLTNEGSYETQVACDDGAIHVLVGGERFSFWQGRRGVGAPGAVKHPSARAEVKAPMPGKVVKLLVAAGDEVSAGQGVLLFEAMKMQNEIKSPQDGIVGELFVVEGQAVETRDRMFVIRPN